MNHPLNPENLSKEGLSAILVDFGTCFDLAQRMDAMYPELDCSFTGTPSERLTRVFNYLVDEYAEDKGHT